MMKGIYTLNGDGLGSADPEHLEKVRRTLQKYNMYAEVAMRGIEPERLAAALEVTRKIGADLLRDILLLRKI